MAEQLLLFLDFPDTALALAQPWELTRFTAKTPFSVLFPLLSLSLSLSFLFGSRIAVGSLQSFILRT